MARTAPAVAAALESLVSVELMERDRVNAADVALADATLSLLKFGPAAAELTGRSMSKLRRLARRAGETHTPPGSTTPGATDSASQMRRRQLAEFVDARSGPEG